MSGTNHAQGAYSTTAGRATATIVDFASFYFLELKLLLSVTEFPIVTGIRCIHSIFILGEREAPG